MGFKSVRTITIWVLDVKLHLKTAFIVINVSLSTKVQIKVMSHEKHISAPGIEKRKQHIHSSYLSGLTETCTWRNKT